MEIILLENIKKLGTIGQKVKVKAGYARNFLLKNKKALLANKKNIEIFEKQKNEINKKNEAEKQKAKEINQIINNRLVFHTTITNQSPSRKNGCTAVCRSLDCCMTRL